MSAHIENETSLRMLNDYPQWAQDLVGYSNETKLHVIEHELWVRMRECWLDAASTRRFMVGTWPVIERFPGYMAHNLLKTHYGRNVGETSARRWLVRNIRVEQTHAEHWLNWAEGAGVPKEEVIYGDLSPDALLLHQWCEYVSSQETLAAGMIATNYAIEGATGEWANFVYQSQAYTASFPQAIRAKSLRWLELHASYDDKHPWEALSIVCALLGPNPDFDTVMHLVCCVKRTFTCMCKVLDSALGDISGDERSSSNGWLISKKRSTNTLRTHA